MGVSSLSTRALIQQGPLAVSVTTRTSARGVR